MASQIYCLFEECEKTNGQYSYQILAISPDRDLLRELMKTKVAVDEHGLIAKNGVEYYDDDTFTTNADFNFGYLNYHISNEKCLLREELIEEINKQKQKTSATFEETIWRYPESKEIRLFLTECRDGNISIYSLLDFLNACKKEARLTNSDLQTIKKDTACQRTLFSALETYQSRNENTKNWKKSRMFYSEERQAALLKVLKDAYETYKTKQ